MFKHRLGIITLAMALALGASGLAAAAPEPGGHEDWGGLTDPNPVKDRAWRGGFAGPHETFGPAFRALWPVHPAPSRLHHRLAGPHRLGPLLEPGGHRHHRPGPYPGGPGRYPGLRRAVWPVPRQPGHGHRAHRHVRRPQRHLRRLPRLHQHPAGAGRRPPGAPPLPRRRTTPWRRSSPPRPRALTSSWPMN